MADPGAAAQVAKPIPWKIHDRTHLEFALDYPIGSEPADAVWEAYFFVPESFRIHEETYPKKALYDDLQSYVRFAVPGAPFSAFGDDQPDSPLSEVRATLAACARGTPSEDARAVRAVRVYACSVRAAALAAFHEIEEHLADPTPGKALVPLVEAFVADATRATEKLHQWIRELGGVPLADDVKVALAWVDEDVSLAIETLSADLGVRMVASNEPDPLRARLAGLLTSRAVAEARHRRSAGYRSVVSSNASTRDAESLEFRRHVLKRFTSSALWLSVESSQTPKWIVHGLYALAAATAMALATATSFGTTAFSHDFLKYSVLVVLAYALKDRTKAFLQTALSTWMSKRHPDRLWRIRDCERNVDVGVAHERAGFVPFRKVPAEVLDIRRLTREHLMEERARPERVIWHRKRVRISAQETRRAIASFRSVTEIYRLNVGHWLLNTDDPKRRFVFADPANASIHSAKARRVYNINVVFRLSLGSEPAPWQRIRVVVSRKGIERVDIVR